MLKYEWASNDRQKEGCVVLFFSIMFVYEFVDNCQMSWKENIRIIEVQLHLSVIAAICQHFCKITWYTTKLHIGEMNSRLLSYKVLN